MAYPCGKGLDKGTLLWVGESAEVGVCESKEGKESGPILPKFCSGVASLSHDPMGCCSSRSSAKTKEQSLVLRLCICQEASCVKGKEALNLVRKSLSVSLKLPRPPCLKERLARSAILLFAPAMEKGANGELWFAACRR